MDIFKRPVIIIILVVAVLTAVIWSYISNSIQAKKAAEQAQQNTTQTVITDLSTVDAADFDEVVKKEFATARAKALEADAKNKLAAIQIEMPSLALNSGNDRYIFTSENDTVNNWSITFSQLTQNFIRARIPKEDYLGVLPAIDTVLWKFNYVTALQIAEKSGGKDWRETNGLNSVKLTLRHAGANNWLLWSVEYTAANQTFSKIIDANSGKVVNNI